MQAMSVKVGDVDLFVERMGEGPPLVLLHGGPGLNMEPFKPTLERAAEFAEVIFYDQRGCGRSSRPPLEKLCDIKYHIVDLEGLREHFGFERVILLGHSFGSYLAMAYAIEHVDRVMKLILVSPTLPYPETLAQIQRFNSLMSKEMLRRIGKINLSRMSPEDKARRRMDEALPLYFHNPEALAEFRRRNIQPAGELIESCSQKIMSRDLRGGLGGLTMPVTIIVGREDRRTPVEYSEELAGYLADAKLIVMKQSGHFPFMEEPDLFTKLLRTEIEIIRR